MGYRTPVDARVRPKTTAYSIKATDVNIIFTNEGAGSQVEFTLLPASQGQGPYTFHVRDAVGIKITAVGNDTIRVGDAVTGAAGSIEADAVGATITLVAIDGAKYVALADVGAW